MVSVMIDSIPFCTLDELKGVPHPFPYQGSKRYLANAIIPLIPDGTSRLIEPFCGSAAVSVAARYTHKISQVVLADINAPLVELWNAIIDTPDALAEEYGRMWDEQLSDPKEYFMRVRAHFNEEPNPSALLYLMNRIVKGSIRYGRDGRFNQSADNRRLGARPQVVSTRIHGVSNLMQGARVFAKDYAEIVAEAEVGDLVYMDPPYQGTSNNADHRYAAGLRREDYEMVLDEMNHRELSYMVSYDVVDSHDTYGKRLSDNLGLIHLHLCAGTSTQATLLGKKKQTVESLYLSAALVDRLGGEERIPALLNPHIEQQGALFG